MTTTSTTPQIAKKDRLIAHLDQLHTAAMAMYNRRYNNTLYRAAVAGRSDTYANRLINAALGICGSPYYHIDIMDMATVYSASPDALAFLYAMTEAPATIQPDIDTTKLPHPRLGEWTADRRLVAHPELTTWVMVKADTVQSAPLFFVHCLHYNQPVWGTLAEAAEFDYNIAMLVETPTGAAWMPIAYAKEIEPKRTEQTA
jgi:hypothetical protein